jgi:hypothetical protein
MSIAQPQTAAFLRSDLRLSAKAVSTALTVIPLRQVINRQTHAKLAIPECAIGASGAAFGGSHYWGRLAPPMARRLILKAPGSAGGLLL